MALSSKTQNKRGNSPLWKENLGYVATFIESRTSIVVDAYEGFDDTYKERETPKITIENDAEIIFEGTMAELVLKLKQ